MSENVEKKYVINLEQLKQLCLDKTTAEKRMEIQISVLSNPYKEPPKPLLKTISEIIYAIVEEATRPQTKKVGKVK